MITSEDVFFAIPKLKGQLSCQDFYDGIYIKADIEKDEPIMYDNIIKKSNERSIPKRLII